MNLTTVNTGSLAGWGWKPIRPARTRATIAAALMKNRDVLSLSTPRLVADITAAYGVGRCTAYEAVSAARSQTAMGIALHVDHVGRVQGGAVSRG